jgi:hypothetical protein
MARVPAGSAEVVMVVSDAPSPPDAAPSSDDEYAAARTSAAPATAVSRR